MRCINITKRRTPRARAARANFDVEGFARVRDTQKQNTAKQNAQKQIAMGPKAPKPSAPKLKAQRQKD